MKNEKARVEFWITENGKRVRKTVHATYQGESEIQATCELIAADHGINPEEVEVEYVIEEGYFSQIIQRFELWKLEDFKKVTRRLGTKVLVNDNFPCGVLAQRVYSKDDADVDNWHFEYIPLLGRYINLLDARSVNSTDMQGKMYNPWEHACKSAEKIDVELPKENDKEECEVRKYDKIKSICYGDEKRFGSEVKFPDRCPACGAEKGKEHATGCEIKECPVCGGRWTDCHHSGGCIPEGMNVDDVDDFDIIRTDNHSVLVEKLNDFEGKTIKKANAFYCSDADVEKGELPLGIQLQFTDNTNVVIEGVLCSCDDYEPKISWGMWKTEKKTRVKRQYPEAFNSDSSSGEMFIGLNY